jgi:two-component system, cell cycle sensor histidine kinase and response regulator CckA
MNPTIMVVDDEPLVRSLTARILREAGLEVIEAPDGRDAWVRLQSLAPSIHLVLSDVVMPHLTGTELAGRIRQAWPYLPVLLMSAYTPEQLAARGLNGTDLEILTKPFDVQTLVQKVRACMRPSV